MVSIDENRALKAKSRAIRFSSYGIGFGVPVRIPIGTSTFIGDTAFFDERHGRWPEWPPVTSCCLWPAFTAATNGNRFGRYERSSQCLVFQLTPQMSTARSPRARSSNLRRGRLVSVDNPECDFENQSVTPTIRARLGVDDAHGSGTALPRLLKVHWPGAEAFSKLPPAGDPRGFAPPKHPRRVAVPASHLAHPFSLPFRAVSAPARAFPRVRSARAGCCLRG